MRRTIWRMLAALLALGAGATAAATGDATRQLEAVGVAGLQPGPSLWRVSRGEHEMWILGTLSPVPKRMQWEAADVESIIRESQQVLLGPSINVRSDMGFFAQLATWLVTPFSEAAALNRSVVPTSHCVMNPP